MSLRRAWGMTTLELPEAAQDLADHFGISPPMVRVTQSRQSRAFLQENVIEVSATAWRGLEDSLLHEFSHLLAYHATTGTEHGWQFFEALVRVAGAWYGDARLYGWSLEYLSVYVLAFDSGLTEQPWAHRRLTQGNAR